MKKKVQDIIKRGILTEIVETKAVEGESTKVTFKLSVETVDRSGDIVKISGINLKNYLKNPVVLYNHNHEIPAIGTGENLHIDGDALVGTINFHKETQLSRELATLAEKGIMRAVSIGFIPKKYYDIPTSNGYSTRVYEQSELLEFSLVNIPANQEALVMNSFEASDLTEDLVELKSFIFENVEVKDFADEDEDPIDKAEIVIEEKAVEIVEKAGKVLSSSNLEKLMSAMLLIKEVIATAEDEEEEDEPIDEPTDEEPMNENSKSPVQKEEIKSERPKFNDKVAEEILNKFFKS